MSNVIDIDLYRPTTSDSFFFDNNIWMYLYCPIGNYAKKKQEKYGNFLSSIKTVGRPIFLNALILSEFTNAWLRMEYAEWIDDQPSGQSTDYKRDFVGSKWYKEAITDIIASIQQIIKISTPSSDEFTSFDPELLYKGLFECDFNDNYYLALASKKKWHIVTDDADFFKGNQLGIKIITANNKL